MAVRFRDRGLKRIQRELSLLGGAKITIGYQDDEVASIAAFQEFGTINIPARPFMRRAIRENLPAIQSSQRQVLKAVIAGRFGAKEGAEAIGDFIRRLIVAQIDSASSWAPPLDPKTIARKGSSAPLVDTGRMRDSVTVEVTL